MIVFRSSLFSLGPRVSRSQDMLEVTTPLLLRALSGFSYKRTVTIDARRRTVYVFKTRGWFFNSHKRLEFDDVDHITYSFSSFWTSWDWRGRVHDLIEVFSIGLELRGSGEVVPLARYFGEGAAGDFSTWMMGDSLIDAAGTQEQESLSFVTDLRKILGVPLGPKGIAPRADAQGRSWKCSSCGRAVVPEKKCLYCGGVAQPI